MRFRKYDLNYEEGKCPYRYEFVRAHNEKDIYIDSYCRKLSKKRFGNPDIKPIKEDKRRQDKSLENAERAY